MKNRFPLFFLITGAVFLFDRLSKWWIDGHMQLNTGREVVSGFFRLFKTYNRGMVFGFLHHQSRPWIMATITTLSLVALALLLYLFLRSTKTLATVTAMAFVAGGAVGNILDRILYGHVVDFIELYFRSYSWPVFNIADTFITLGTLLLVYSEFRGKNAS